MARKEVTLALPTDLVEQLESLAHAQCQTFEEQVVAELRRSVSRLSGISCDRLARDQSSELHLTSPIIGLVEGLLTGETTIGEVLCKGDFGIGTLNHLDGEVVILDGVAYQQGWQGRCRLVDDAEKTPFMTVTRWQPGRAVTVPLSARMDRAQLLAELERHFPSPNLFYAIRLTGRFESLRARSVKKQKVDRPLVAVAKDQAVFELGAGSGTLVGFWSPPFMGSALTVPGFHLHFLSEDKMQGGHLLEAVLLEGEAQIQALHHTDTDLPKTQTFLGADLTRDPAEDLESAEK
ncbi:hypothetical protein CHLNCDRAFT_134073 [Chlorella variabilis]|uniref:Alpha-acetolactate decarboxylase n=1 Tax=Chlorella variabilis TaxID=554065 RepID=E1ZEY1_CHLVA|nr:hypothetical protein CHLNCDRAFT_134073 [Chlorella variabilis]EFN55738.1 hypothetical protein CHLNCDRAFT_134073 [Chlorella variabilis]|eukprot:XP_005847840.1 hypothetical protein CHLNCDRAFT_134073 [Chlorella variabilis]